MFDGNKESEQIDGHKSAKIFAEKTRANSLAIFPKTHFVRSFSHYVQRLP